MVISAVSIFALIFLKQCRILFTVLSLCFHSTKPMSSSLGPPTPG